MPLNMMVMCGDINPAVVSICDCTNHMLEGGKKDAICIADIFQENVNEFEADTQMSSFMTEKQMSRRPANVSNLSQGILISWWRTCPVALLQ